MKNPALQLICGHWCRARNGAGLGDEAAVTLDTSSDPLSYSPVPRLLVLDKRDAIVR